MPRLSFVLSITALATRPFGRLAVRRSTASMRFTWISAYMTMPVATSATPAHWPEYQPNASSARAMTGAATLRQFMRGP